MSEDVLVKGQDGSFSHTQAANYRANDQRARHSSGEHGGRGDYQRKQPHPRCSPFVFLSVTRSARFSFTDDELVFIRPRSDR